MEVVRCLLEALDALTAVDARDALGATALWAAARNGRVQVTELLLEKKAQQDQSLIDIWGCGCGCRCGCCCCCCCCSHFATPC